MVRQQPKKTTQRRARRSSTRAAALSTTAKRINDVEPLPKRREEALTNLTRRVRKSQHICALFSGPDETGKTLAAEFLARKLNLTLYHFDLSQVVSEYIGETEKNLRRLFEEAEASDAILFFDEADALFGKRSTTKDSHDRYANPVLNYLCGRLESFQGLVVLACSRRHSIDSTFSLKMRFHLSFGRTAHRSATPIQR